MTWSSIRNLHCGGEQTRQKRGLEITFRLKKNTRTWSSCQKVLLQSESQPINCPNFTQLSNPPLWIFVLFWFECCQIAAPAFVCVDSPAFVPTFVPHSVITSPVQETAAKDSLAYAQRLLFLIEEEGAGRALAVGSCGDDRVNHTHTPFLISSNQGLFSNPGVSCFLVITWWFQISRIN